MSTAVVILARGGSKGIPRKNLRPIGGVPLVTRAVRTALEADVGHVWVSTDDAEICAAARDAGANIRYCPGVHTDTTVDEPLIDCVRSMGTLPTHAILMQCTSPFTHALEVERVADRLRRGAECVITIAPFYGLLWGLDRDGINCAPVAGIDGCQPRKRRQDRDPPWLETGALYGMRTDLLLATGSRFCGRVQAVVMPKHRSAEIDDAWDLAVCERMADWAQQQGPGAM